MQRNSDSAFSGLDSAVNRGRAFLERHDEAILLVLMLGVALWMISHTRTEYSSNARLFPMIVLVILTGLILVRMLIHFGIMTRISVVEKFLEMQAESGQTAMSLMNEDDHESKPIRVIRMCGWLILLTAMMAWIGILVSIPLFVTAFVLVESDLGLPRSLGIAVLTYVFVYVLFVYILGLRI